MKRNLQRLFLVLVVMSIAGSTQAQLLRGLVTSQETGETLIGVNVYVEGTAKGTTTDEQGVFRIELEGETLLTFSALGYESKELRIAPEKDSTIQVKLKTASLDLTEAVVAGKKENVGKSIMKRVIANKKSALNPEIAYSYDSYLRTSMDKWVEKKKRDTTEVEEGWQPAYWNESFARQHYQDRKFKREVKAELKQTGDSNLRNSGSTGIDRDFNGTGKYIQYNPLEYFRQPQDAMLDLYENSIKNTSLTDRPITSPLSSTAAFVNYKFKLVDIQEIEGDSFYVIDVEPRFKQEPLFSGKLAIKKDGYLLKEAVLTLPSGALNAATDFKMELEYALLDEQYWRPIYRKFNYNGKTNGKKYQVETLAKDTSFNFNPVFEKNFFNNELIVYETSALEPDTVFLQKMRPNKLTAKQQKFQSEQDSIWRYRQSPEYYHIQDSIFNHNSLLDFLVEGVGWKRREKGITLYFNSLLDNIQPFGVGGYRQGFGGSINKEFLSSNELRFGYDVNYGIKNEDWKGELDISYTYLPRKFARFYGEVGNMYEMITLNQSIEGIFSRSNFIQNKHFGFGHSFEVSNGIYLTTDFEYADKQSIEGIELTNWSDELFGNLNAPVAFERYRGLFFNMEVMFKFNQQYITRGRKKIVLGTRYPTLKLIYRKGIPNIGQSEVDFDQLEINLYQKTLPMKYGSTNWNVKAGSFVNTRNLRELEYRFIRGSDRFIFSDPLNNLQLLGPTLSTPKPYFMGSIIHHFDGFFLDKVPLLNRLQMELLGGAAILSVPDENLTHAELYAGLGKKFRLFGETVQVALYAVTADNNLEQADITYKIGFNFYHAFSQQWEY